MIMRSIFTLASVQLHCLCFCFHSVFRFLFLIVFFFFFLGGGGGVGFLNFTIAIVKQRHYKRISLHLHPVLYHSTLCYIRSAVRTSGICVQFIHHSWLVDYRNI